MQLIAAALLLYLSTEQWLAGSRQIASQDIALTAAVSKQEPAEREAATRVFNVLTDLVKRSVLEEVTGLGASSFAIERGVYRNKLFVHHRKGAGDGFLWSAFGKTPHRLEALDLLPADTALASFADLDIAQLIGVLRQGIEQAGIPEAKQALDQALLQFTAMTGMPLDEVLQSLGGSVGLIVTLDPTKPLALPPGTGTESIPTPRLAIFVKTKSDRIFQQLDKSMADNKTVVRVDEPGLRMRTMPVPALPQMTVRATAAQWGDYLVIASDDQLIRDVIAAQKDGKGLKSTPEFAKLTAGLPAEGNGFQLATQRFADIWNRFQAQMMKNQPAMAPEQAALMEKLLAWQKSGAAYSVSTHLDNGWLVTSKGTQGAGQLAAPLLIAPVAVAAGVALPIFSKAKERSKATKYLNKEKQIGIACKLYAQDNHGKFPPTLEELVPDYIPTAELFVSPFAPEVPMGYDYTAGLTEQSPPDTILLEDKFAPREKERVVVKVDVSGAVIPAP